MSPRRNKIVRFCGAVRHTGRTMLIELWERLRGYDKWVQTTAKVESSKVVETPVANRYGTSYVYNSDDVLVWSDEKGERQWAYFKVPEDSPLYLLVDNETIPIRYNLAQPDQFYLRELLRTRVRTFAKQALLVAFLVLIVVAAIFANRGHH